ncbi:hypothetical protein VOLCADRAFT_94260 [Volvox carteri f. nagariensis]|uniref:Uncharacterized protein n=1 Tax=Volvox carteri f. nagariensis TaxID=3068 RepID=D8U416_VOLCA|nr:uncharacterized protein VOLCADRAFT_94260 [Volvox carteri f. nagariensis]EFJ45418.1 hypothetical protein VOLCADRAFT_94260 [Volvox carteri f. nagariensis]|eukprot:XP_002953445.1 hypothetical protein VOLCADRAFT_94260 [Volvox carteri f. nagariensis]
MVPPEPQLPAFEPALPQARRNNPDTSFQTGHDDSSSVFLSSDDIESAEALTAAENTSVATAVHTRDAGALEDHVTAVKDGVKLPVRLDFLNDRQATGDDTDQPSRLPGSSRAAMQAIAAWRRQASTDQVNQVLSAHRPDSELVLIWVIPGASPGLMLIELHAPPSFVSAAGDGLGDGNSTRSSGSAAPHRIAASTGALESAWRTHGIAASGVGPAWPMRGLREAAAAMAAAECLAPTINVGTGSAQAIGPAAAAAAAAGSNNADGSDRLTGEAGAGGRQPAALTASLNRARVFGLSAPGPVQQGGQERRLFGAMGWRGVMCSSGALTVVVVPDAGMEGEVCALLAMQHQQLPLPVCPEESLGENPPIPQSLQSLQRQQQQQGQPFAGVPLDMGPSRVYASAQPSVGIESTVAAVTVGNLGFAGNDEGAVGGLLAKLDKEDKDDARARERFLWDLGAWLELTGRRAAAREAVATGPTDGIAGVAAANAARSAASLRQAPGRAVRGSDQAQQRLSQQQQQRQHSAQHPQAQQRRVLGDLLPVSEIEALGGAPHNAGITRVAPGLGLETWVAPPRTGEQLTTVANAQQPMPQTALELLGFACSRGWAATSTHIVLGLMDMGFSMHAINASVQGAHGWSALHLAVASGSAELVAMTALWRSYGRYGDGAAVQEEWRAMLAAPGPGGLTPLHLAAVLPKPAIAAMDLLSTLPAETLSTWFDESACDGCTPAHYAFRAGNTHLNEHALLCLATGTAALDLGTAQGLQEVLPYLGELQAELSTCSESADLEGGAHERASSGGNVRSGGVVAAAVADAAAGRLPSGSVADANALASRSPCESTTESMETACEDSPKGSSGAGYEGPVDNDSEGCVDNAVLADGEALPASGGPTSGDVVGSGEGAMGAGARPASPPRILASNPPSVGVARAGSSSSSSSGTFSRSSRGNTVRPATHSMLGRPNVRSSSPVLEAAVSASAVASAGAATAGAATAVVASTGRHCSRSLRRFLPRLMSRFQCLGGSRPGSSSNRGTSWSRSQRVPVSTSEIPSLAASTPPPSGTSASATRPWVEPPSVSREGDPHQLQPRGVAEAQQSSTSNSSASPFAVTTLLHSLSPVSLQGGQEHPHAHPHPTGSTAGAPLNTCTGTPPSPNGTNAHSLHRTSSSRNCPPQPQLHTRGEESQSPGQSVPIQASTVPLQRTTDSQAWAPEPWLMQKRAWPQPSSVVVELLERVSQAASTLGSVGTNGDSWQASPGSGTQCHSSGAVPQPQPAVPMAVPMAQAAPAPNSTSPPPTISLEQAQQVALQIVAAARNLSASASAEMSTALPTAGAGALGAAAALMRSAPPEVGDRILAEFLTPLCNVTLQRRLQQQVREHQERLRLRMMEMLHFVRPAYRTPSGLQPSLPPPPQQQQQASQHHEGQWQQQQQPQQEWLPGLHFSSNGSRRAGGSGDEERRPRHASAPSHEHGCHRLTAAFAASLAPLAGLVIKRVNLLQGQGQERERRCRSLRPGQGQGRRRLPMRVVADAAAGREAIALIPHPGNGRSTQAGCWLWYGARASSSNADREV